MNIFSTFRKKYLDSSAKYIFSLDQGTSSSRAILFDHSGNQIAQHQKSFRQHYPQEGWVEHDPEEIWQSIMLSMFECISIAKIEPSQIASIGITNQRETTIVWDKSTGKAIHPAIVWQDRRTTDYCRSLTSHQDLIYQKTGLILDPYFSASKIRYILDKVEGAQEKAVNGKLAFGTVDSWLLWKLTEGICHSTDVSNASRTMLFNIQTLAWDEELLQLFNIPKELLPEVVDSSAQIATTDVDILGHQIPIGAMIGDQQAALFGQKCFTKGQVKCTYGTGCFMVVNTGKEIIRSKHKMISTIAWKINNQTHYALEGSAFVTGAALQWLVEGLRLFKDMDEIEEALINTSDSGGVYFVPALTGLGAPHWDPHARGSFFGITRGTQKEHIARAGIESIAFQVDDILEAMSQDLSSRASFIKVDGGSTKNDLLMQWQADISQVEVQCTKVKESTALGAAMLAGLAVGFWEMDDFKSFNITRQTFKAKLTLEEISSNKLRWQKAVQKSKDWA